MPQASTEGQQNLNSVMIEDVLKEPDQREELERALEIITDDSEDECPACQKTSYVMDARTLARAKAVPKDLLPMPSEDRSIIFAERFIITEKGGERAVMKATSKKVPAVRRSYKVQG